MPMYCDSVKHQPVPATSDSLASDQLSAVLFPESISKGFAEERTVDHQLLTTEDDNQTTWPEQHHDNDDYYHQSR